MEFDIRDLTDEQLDELVKGITKVKIDRKAQKYGKVGKLIKFLNMFCDAWLVVRAFLVTR